MYTLLAKSFKTLLKLLHNEIFNTTWCNFHTRKILIWGTWRPLTIHRIGMMTWKLVCWLTGTQVFRLMNFEDTWICKIYKCIHKHQQPLSTRQMPSGILRPSWVKTIMMPQISVDHLEIRYCPARPQLSLARWAWCVTRLTGGFAHGSGWVILGDLIRVRAADFCVCCLVLSPGQEFPHTRNSKKIPSGVMPSLLQVTRQNMLFSLRSSYWAVCVLLTDENHHRPLPCLTVSI